MRSRLKNIGIITYHYYYNYGTMLQAYALQEAIDRCGCRCEILNYRKPNPAPSIWFRIKRIPIYLTQLVRVWRLSKFADKLTWRRPMFDSFARDFFHQTERIFRDLSDFENIENEYDLFITGSDQTFSPKIGLNPCILLDFVKDRNKKAAYAPSIGTIQFNEDQLAQFKKYLDRYKHLSCREISGSQFMRPLTNNEVVDVLDPTLLLNKEDWNSLATPRQIDRPYILCYFLGHQKHYESAIQYLKDVTGYDVYYIPCDYHDMTSSKQLLLKCGPLEWLSLIKNATIVCTDSFHGLCFSINFEKEFYAFNKCAGDFKSGDNSRISDLLNRFDLSGRFIDKNTTMFRAPIDYSDVNEKLNSERVTSKDYLNKILND